MTADESSPRKRRTERDQKPVKLFTPDHLPNNVGGKRRGRKITCKGKLMDLNSPRIEKNEVRSIRVRIRVRAVVSSSLFRGRAPYFVPYL